MALNVNIRKITFNYRKEIKEDSLKPFYNGFFLRGDKMAVFKFRKCISWGENIKVLYSDNNEDQKFFSMNEHSSVIMQWTGLYDSLGNEVYENDFIKVNNEIYIVVWDNRNARFVLVKKKNNYLNFRELVTSGEIIGNIMETPELAVYIQ
jgi:hypothetical protein